MSLSQEIIFLSNHSKVFVRIPLLDNTFLQQPDLFFYVDIIFNRSTIAQSVITIVDNDYGELIISATISYSFKSYFLNCDYLNKNLTCSHTN